MTLAFDTIEIPGGYRGLMVYPTAPILVGRTRLQTLREQLTPSSTDLAIIEQARRWSPLHAFIFRGRSNDGRGYWRLHDELDPHETTELCALMFRSHLPLKRALLKAGSIDNIYIEWRPKETACFEAGLRRLRETLRRELASSAPDSAQTRSIRLDLWLSDRISLFSAAGMEDVLETILPPRMERRFERLARVRPLLPED